MTELTELSLRVDADDGVVTVDRVDAVDEVITVDAIDKSCRC